MVFIIFLIITVIIVTKLGMANAVDNYQHREMSAPLSRDKLQKIDNLEVLEISNSNLKYNFYLTFKV